jgi:4-hydroxy-tetrahydrodipicolinate synthase
MDNAVRGVFKGLFTALVTPFRNGSLDERAFRDMVEWQIAEGTDGLVPAGTTGESPTLSHDEHRLVVEWCVDQAAGRVPAIAGTGSNSTAEAVELSIQAEKAGADAVLVVTPYYNRPTQDGLPALQGGQRRARNPDHHLQHSRAFGGRYVGRHHEAAVRAWKHHRRQGRDRKRDAGVAAAPSALGPWFNQLSGEDASALGFMAHGGHGCISVTANIAPRMCAEFQHACLRRDFTLALGLHDRLMPLHTALFLETSPAPVKYALSVLGKCRENLRLPLVSVTESTRLAVRDAMVCAGLMN